MAGETQITSNIIELNNSLQEKESELEFLQQTFTAVGSELDLDEVFKIVSERARALINAETLLIPIIDSNDETYTYRAGAGKGVEEIINESLPLDIGLCGWVLRHNRPWWSGVLSELNEEDARHWGDEIGSSILVPLQGRKQFLGGIVGRNKTDGTDFDKKDLNLLQLFASIVSIAIENAMAVKSMEESRRLNEDYRLQLKTLNKQLTDSSKELEYLALYDSITALPNRSLLYDRLSRDIAVAEKKGSEICVLLINIDCFKDVNEALGHEWGDELLEKIARRFEEEINHDETLARLGGDEFIIVLPGVSQATVSQRAARFINSLKNEFSIQHNRVVISARIGIATYPEHGTTINSLLSHANFAMYEAKNRKLAVCQYNPENDHMAHGRLELVADARRALDEKQFEMHYQPKVDTQTGEVVAAEALGRWHSEKHGNVPPSIFIDVLERNGLIDEFTFWAIETALLQAGRCRDSGNALRIAVNMSPQTLMHPDFKDNIDRVVRGRKDGELLTFEITENLFLSEFDRLTDVLEHICELGVELSIDDYGTGYSSLSRLCRLPVSELKIDQSFIKGVLSNKDDVVVVHSTIGLAHNLGLTVVAEGVEQQATLELLKQLGCDTVQGYLISKPLAENEFEAFINKGNSE